jgi:hypothetical protein
MATKVFTPVLEVAREALARTGGSLTSVPNGRLIRISGSDKPWEINEAWSGRELTSWSMRRSNWSKTIVVTFSGDLSSSAAKLPQFTLSLTPPLTDEEVTNSAEVHMMLLNLARSVAAEGGF